MEREILFRGKRADNGEWVEGYFVKYQPCASKDEWIVGIVPDYASSLYLIEVALETVSRFTSLTDKNGRRIFEGDILDLTPYMITDVGVVKFGEYKDLDMGNDYPCGHVGFYVDVEKQRISVRKDILFFVSECKVLGNIHDNPELLGGDENE